MFTDIRDMRHWREETYCQRITKKQWEQLLLNHEERIIVDGRTRFLKARKLSSNIYEIYKA